MATRADARRRGFGRQILDLLIGHVADRGGGLLWCNARTPALHLYERADFLPRGDVFELPEIGPHLLMWRIVEPP
jgi:ribosomal protein S18 acetylase RimI-like enzyme